MSIKIEQMFSIILEYISGLELLIFSESPDAYALVFLCFILWNA